MDILGVTPVEIFLILVLGLIVFGPERLPEIGRFLGRMLAKLLAWQQQSPEAQMIQQMRQDIDQEIVKLRDEIVQAQKQLDVSSDVKKIQGETRSLLSTPKKKEPVIKASKQARAVDQKDNSATSPITESGPSESSEPANGVAASSDSTAMMSDAPASEPRVNGQQVDSSPTADGDTRAGPTMADLEALTTQIQALMAEMHTLKQHLRDQGMLDADWQAPSPPLSEKAPSS